MKTYEVSYKYETWATYTVDAHNASEAENMAYEMLQRDEGSYLHNGEWTDKVVEDVTPPPPSLTPDQEAFVLAYCDGVSDAPRDIVIDYLFDRPVDSEYYTSIADAYNMWDFARAHFQKEQTK